MSVQQTFFIMMSNVDANCNTAFDWLGKMSSQSNFMKHQLSAFDVVIMRKVYSIYFVFVYFCKIKQVTNK